MNGQAMRAAPKRDARPASRRRPTPVQRRWLARGVGQPGGKLPLFDGDGRAVRGQTVDRCVREGWAEPWIRNPIKPDWLVCKLTAAGRAALGGSQGWRAAGRGAP